MKTAIGLIAALGLAAAAQAQDRLVVVNKGDNTAALVDSETYDVIARYPTGENPHEVYVSADGRTAYVSDYGNARGSTVTVIDLAGGEVTATWDLGANQGPHGIWVSRDGSRVWATTETSGTVIELDSATGEITEVWTTDQQVSHQLVPTPDESKLYVANIGSGSVTAIDRRDGSVVSVPTGAGAEGIDVSPDGREVWVTNRAANTISVIDAETDEVIESFESGGQFPIRAKFTPDGSEVYVSNAVSGSVAVFDAASRELLATIEVGAVPVGILMDPDGGRAFVANTRDDIVTVIDIASRTVTETFATGDEPDGMAWAVEVAD